MSVGSVSNSNLGLTHNILLPEVKNKIAHLSMHVYLSCSSILATGNYSIWYLQAESLLKEVTGGNKLYYIRLGLGDTPAVASEHLPLGGNPVSNGRANFAANTKLPSSSNSTSTCLSLQYDHKVVPSDQRTPLGLCHLKRGFCLFPVWFAAVLGLLQNKTHPPHFRD